MGRLGNLAEDAVEHGIHEHELEHSVSIMAKSIQKSRTDFQHRLGNQHSKHDLVN